MTFLPPVHLREEHQSDFAGFDCGETSLNSWLQTRALTNEGNKSSRTYLVYTDSGVLAGFFSLSANSIVHEMMNAASRRNMPDPVPVILIGRLAVAREFQGCRLGAAMLCMAVDIARRISELGGAVYVAVHPISESASGFYQRYGFRAAKQGGTLLLFRL